MELKCGKFHTVCYSGFPCSGLTFKSSNLGSRSRTMSSTPAQPPQMPGSFAVVDDLAAWLTLLGPHYALYAAPLWNYGVRTIQELSNASAETLKQAGVSLNLHVDNIRAAAAQQGVHWERVERNFVLFIGGQ